MKRVLLFLPQGFEEYEARLAIPSIDHHALVALDLPTFRFLSAMPPQACVGSPQRLSRGHVRKETG